MQPIYLDWKWKEFHNSLRNGWVCGVITLSQYKNLTLNYLFNCVLSLELFQLFPTEFSWNLNARIMAICASFRREPTLCCACLGWVAQVVLTFGKHLCEVITFNEAKYMIRKWRCSIKWLILLGFLIRFPEVLIILINFKSCTT